MKSYKLNKTFENSIYPLEQELKSINNNTISSTFNNLAGVVFSGIGTSVLFQDECIPKVLSLMYDSINFSDKGYGRAIGNTVVVIILFVILFFVGKKGNKLAREEKGLLKKKKTSQGRSELRERFHKSIINDIVIGLSFVDKAEEIKYMGDVAEMYLYEAVYYFMQAKIQMEEMELLDTEKSAEHDKLIKEIGQNTIETTCKVFHSGLKKLYGQLPEGTENELIGDIIKSISPYIKNRD